MPNTVKVGLVGRGMVGSIVNRIIINSDAPCVEFSLLSSTQDGQEGPFGRILNSRDPNILERFDIIVTSQGSEWTKEIHPLLRKSGWGGYWVDASSALRMSDTCTIVLDPINRHSIVTSLRLGTKDFAGGNCTTSLLLMAIAGLLKADQVTSVTTNTAQAASGAGAKQLNELIRQTKFCTQNLDTNQPSLELAEKAHELCRHEDFPDKNLSYPLAFGLSPAIGAICPKTGFSEEELKTYREGNKILGIKDSLIPISGTCARTPHLRCHTQLITIDLRAKLHLKIIEELIKGSSEYTEFYPNTNKASLALNPVDVSGSVKVRIGRLRLDHINNKRIHAVTVGDQLLWGAALPLIGALRLILKEKFEIETNWSYD